MSEQRLIDAFGVQRQLNMSYYGCGLDGFSLGFREALGLAIQTIENAPTIDTVRHGKWINTSGYDDWYCSKCDFEISFDGYYPTEFDDFKYCGRCGAKMEVEENECA